DPLRLALRLNPEDAWDHNTLGWALTFKNEPDLQTAHREFEEANRLAPDRVGLMKNLANVEHQLGIEGAEDTYKRIIELAKREPGNSLETKWQTGWCLFRLRDLERAGRRLFAATALPLDGDTVRLDLGLVSLCRDRGAEALQQYQLAIARIS